MPARVIGDRAETVSEPLGYHDAVNRYRREPILWLLGGAGGNRAAAAKALGPHRTRLMKLIKALGDSLSRPDSPL